MNRTPLTEFDVKKKKIVTQKWKHFRSFKVSVARLGGFPPNWAVLNLIVRVNIGLGGWTKIGLVFGQFGGFQNI